MSMTVPIFANQKIRVAYKTTENVTISLRGLVRLPDGEIQPITEQKIVSGVTSGTVTSGTFDKPVPTGELIAFTLKVSATIRRGECFLRGNVLYQADDFEAASLCAHYVTSDAPIAMGMFEDPLSGRGYISTQAMTLVGPNNHYAVFTCPSGVRHKITSVYAGVACSAVAADRRIYVNADDPSGQIVNFLSPYDQKASESVAYNFNGSGENSIVIQGTSPIVVTRSAPEIYLISAGYYQISILNPQIGDAISGAFITTERWINA